MQLTDKIKAQGVQIANQVYYLALEDDTGPVGIMWMSNSTVTRIEEIRSVEDFRYWFRYMTTLKEHYTTQWSDFLK